MELYRVVATIFIFGEIQRMILWIGCDPADFVLQDLYPGILIQVQKCKKGGWENIPTPEWAKDQIYQKTVLPLLR